MTTPIRPLHVIAEEIREDWANKTGGVNYAAKPYLLAMHRLNKITDMYFDDDAEGVVTRFLVNAGTWRGETARRVKAELKAMLPKRSRR